MIASEKMFPILASIMKKTMNNTGERRLKSEMFKPQWSKFLQIKKQFEVQILVKYKNITSKKIFPFRSSTALMKNNVENFIR